ncbi:hypothetical protein FRC12_024456, partial [Ceratobasidium sp. 428]
MLSLSIPAGPVNHTLDIWQTLPTDLLVLILKPLILLPRTSYIPLTCTHVCRHWRRVVLSSPSLWSYVDVSRGNALTEHWLLNSANGLIDVRIWQPPENTHLKHEPPPKTHNAIENTRRHIERWRSLDIAFWCGSCMVQTMAFLGRLETCLELDSLTVGPMGKHVLLPAESPGDFNTLRIKPTVLRVDSYCFALDSSLFSTRLTTIEIFSAPDIGRVMPIVERWRHILRATPNLISLTLWHSASWGSFLDSIPEEEAKAPILLPSLKLLGLSASYLEIMLILSRSPLPKLESLRIDSGNSKNVASYIGRLATVAPYLSSLALSCVRHRVVVWDEVFRKLQSLRHLTFFETDHWTAKNILELESLPRSLTSVRLERMYSRDPIRWPPANAATENPPTLSFVGYDNVVRIRSIDDKCQAICLDDYDKENVEDDSADLIYHSRESDIHVGEDLAIVRGPNLELGNTDSYTSDTDDSNGGSDLDNSDQEPE